MTPDASTDWDRPAPGRTAGCGFCFATLDAEDVCVERRPVVRCVRCGRHYHRVHWDAMAAQGLGCTRPGCGHDRVEEAWGGAAGSPGADAGHGLARETGGAAVRRVHGVVWRARRWLAWGMLGFLLLLGAGGDAWRFCHALRDSVRDGWDQATPNRGHSGGSGSAAPDPAPGTEDPSMRLRAAVKRDFEELTGLVDHRRFPGRLRDRADAAAMARWTEGAALGCPEADYLLGWVAETGMGVGGTSDTKEAEARYEAAARAGLPLARAVRGAQLAFAGGSATEQARGVAWLREAAEAELALGQWHLGRCWMAGRGLATDRRAAYGCYEAAARAGLGEAAEAVGQCRERGLGVARDLPAAAAWYELATRMGVESARASLRRVQDATAWVPRTLVIPLRGKVSMELVWVRAGRYRPGGSVEEWTWALGPEGGLSPAEIQAEEDRQREVVLSSGFWLGRTEVTVAQWYAFRAETGYLSQAERDGGAWTCAAEGRDWVWRAGRDWLRPGHGRNPTGRHPATCLGREDARAFCHWLQSKVEQAGCRPADMVCRLPTEEEWEYACRAGLDEGRFWWGAEADEARTRANLAGNDPLGADGSGAAWGRAGAWSDGRGWAAEVESFGLDGRNGNGLSDMLGNVWEWCLDRAEGPRVTGLGTVRGGSFASAPGNGRCAARRRIAENLAGHDVGFRAAMGVARDRE